MHFSLRTLLVATTAVAVYVGGTLGIMRTMNSWPGSGAPGSYSFVYILSGLPTFVLWAVAGAWAFERRERPGMKPLLWGLLLTAAWRLAAPFAQAVVLQIAGPGGGAMQAFFAAFSLVNALMQTVSWALLFYAFVKASEPRPAPVSPWEEPSPGDPHDR